MGVESIMNISQRKKSTPKRLVRLGVDVPFLLVLFTLLVFGVLMVYSASYDFSLAAFGSATYMLNRQLVFLGLGLVVAVMMALLDYHVWKKLAVLAMMLIVLGLAAVLVVSDERHGAVRSLFDGSIQPSEFAKLVTIIYLSVWLYSKREHLSNVSLGLFPLAGILGLIGGLIFLQPDLSAVLTVVLLGGILFFLAGGELRQIAMLVLVALVVGWAVVTISPTGRRRVEDYREGLRDPTQASYHVRRSLEAFVYGGWTGAGIGKSTSKHTGLPVAPTDSIFAVVGEETGILGAGGMVLLYTLFMWRGLLIARDAPDTLGRLLAAGLTFWIVMEAFINMGVVLGLLPFAGNALPLISAGGSSLMATMMAIGILVSVSRMSYRHKETAGHPLGPVVDLRNRKRRRMATPSRTGKKRSGRSLP